MASFEFLKIPAVLAAQRLLGCELERTIDGESIRVRIVETEAYDQTDVASHSYRGKTERNRVMFGPAGILYVYFNYGMHYCCNIVVGDKGHGAAVLLRAVEPLKGRKILEHNRPGRRGVELLNGPAKLCQALKIDKALNGQDLSRPPLKLLATAPLPKNQIVQTTRIGIREGKALPWRFYIRGNAYVSKPVD